MNLVIVESPSKSKTIKKYLGPRFIVKATWGHVRNLPKNELGIEIENNFTPKYIIIPKSRKIISEIKKIAQEAKKIYLATDFDREGEAIAWHIIQATGLDKQKDKDKIKRITFVEITKEAIKKALENPRDIDLKLVDAQQARRILDRLVGYKLSPLLWKKIKSRLSAGRVQSVALKLVVEREKEIEDFTPSEYWEIEAELTKQKNQKSKQPEVFPAKLTRVGDKKINIKNQTQAKKIISDLEGANYQIKDITKVKISKNPPPPFITSTLQQEAFNKLRFSSKKTMLIAQQLYEGINLGKEGLVGLITYMRTDSTNLSWLAINTARKYIKENLGKEYLPPKPRYYKTKTLAAQEAHEAIRPTYIDKTPKDIRNYLSQDQYKLYQLIWQRMLASQIKNAQFEETKITIEAQSNQNSYLLETQGLKNIFLGFLKIYPATSLKEKVLPKFKKGGRLDLIKIIALQKFTQPPPRYTEATLIKKLEENGIGRPSTYAPILSTVQERGYVVREGRILKPTKIGKITNDLLVTHFPEIVDLKFTSKMEKNLDKVATGETSKIKVLNDFYQPFIKNLREKEIEIEKIEIKPQKTDQICEKCGKEMVIREGRYGEFLACSGFPECQNTKPLIKEIEVPCPYCGGKIIQKKTRKRKIFYGCKNYPGCKFASWDLPVKYRCSKCDGLMTKKGKILTCLRCKNKEVLKNNYDY